MKRSRSWAMREFWKFPAVPEKPSRTVLDIASLCCNFSIATVACWRETPGARLNDTVTAGKSPSWLIERGEVEFRAGSGNSDRGISGGSFRRQPKMAGMRRADEQTSASEPHSDFQGEGGIGSNQGREDAIGVGRAVRCACQPDHAVEGPAS